MKELPGWELMLLRTKALAGRPSVPSALRGRVRVRTARSGQARASILNEAPIFVPALAGLRRVRVEASAAGAAVASRRACMSSPRWRPQPSPDSPRAPSSAATSQPRDAGAPRARASPSWAASWTGSTARSPVAAAARRCRSARRPPLDHRRPAHAHLWSNDCLVEPEELVEHAVAEGLGAIAVTDHNAFGGAQATVEAALGTDLLVIPGEEVKTDNQGEVIGLFLEREIAKSMYLSRTRLPQSRSRAASSTSPTRSTGCTRSRT